MPKKTIKAISRAFNKLSAIGGLRAEIALLTSHATDTVYLLRYDTMQYDYISPAVKNLLGYTPDELMQVNLRSLILETRIVTEGMKTIDSFTELEESRKRGEVQKWQADYLMLTKEGKKIWVSDVSYPWFDKKGAIIGSRGSLRDITERIIAEKHARDEMTKTEYADELTGLANSRKFWIRLEEEIKRTRRVNTNVSVILITLNMLDEIRQNYNKKMVEDVIVAISKSILNSLREMDIVSRLDGESFGIILPDTPAEGAVVAAKRLVKTITAYKFSASPNPENSSVAEDTYVTVSVGIADSNKEGLKDASALYKLADAQLYIANNKGENYIAMGES